MRFEEHKSSKGNNWVFDARDAGTSWSRKSDETRDTSSDGISV